MSFRGRVIRRQPVAVFEKPRSIQEQKEQYMFLSRVLRIRQYECMSWTSATGAINWLKEENLIVDMTTLKPDFPSGQSHHALVLRPGQVVSLFLMWNDITGVSFDPSTLRGGFVIRKHDGTWSDLSMSWGSWEPTVSRSAAGVNVSTDTRVFAHNSWVTEGVGNDNGFTYAAPWLQSDGIAQAVYFVHPFFSATLPEPAENQSYASLVDSIDP